MDIYKVIALFVLITSCSGIKKDSSSPIGFTDSEIILAHDLLDKIYSKELPPIECINDPDEASLYQRSLGPMYESIQDEIEASLDDENKVQTLINQCEKDCTCQHLNELIREHQVELSFQMKKIDAQKSHQCLTKFAASFCQTKLFEKIDTDKNDFTYEEENL